MSSVASQATEIHRWVDDNGVVHFGDRPPADVTTEVVVVDPNVYASPSIEDSPVTVASTQRVVMYSTDWCGVCKKARQFFRANRIPFKEYDVEKSSKGKRDYKKMDAQGVPVILVGKKRLNGFSEESFRSVYGGDKSRS